MRKRIKASGVIKLPLDTDIFIVHDASGNAGRMWIAKIGRKKALKGLYSTLEIKDRDGWHYEIEDGGV